MKIFTSIYQKQVRLLHWNERRNSNSILYLTVSGHHEIFTQCNLSWWATALKDPLTIYGLFKVYSSFAFPQVCIYRSDTTQWHWRIQVGGGLGCPLLVQFLLFLCSCQQKVCQERGWRTPPGKSRICHCTQLYHLWFTPRFSCNFKRPSKAGYIVENTNCCPIGYHTEFKKTITPMYANHV